MVRYLGKPKSRLTAEEKVLAGLLARDFFIAAIWVPGDRVDGQPTKLLEISGRLHHVELAEHVYHYLLRTIEELWQHAKRERGYRGRSQKRRFALGLISGFSERTTADAPQHELVVQHERQLQGFVRRRHPRLRAGRRTQVVCDAAYNHGKKTGSRLSIRPPIANKSRTSPESRRARLITTRPK